MSEPFEAGLDGITFESQGSKLLGGLYRGAGIGPRPTAIVLHGLPGVEKNLDFAYELRGLGWNCMYFHYRGSWGSEGDFSLAGEQLDLDAATAWITQQPCVDVERLALIGHSGGGYLALSKAAADPRYKAVVALCPLISPARAPLTSEVFAEFASMLHGIDGPGLGAQYASLPSVELVIERLRGRPVLLLTGAIDDVFDHSHYVALLRAAPWIEFQEYAQGDHYLTMHRKEAVQRATLWLTKRMGS